MDQIPIDGEDFEKRVERVEKVLSKLNEVFVQNDRKEKIEGACTLLLSSPCCEFCDSCLRRSKILAKVLLFVIYISSGGVFYKMFPFFFSIYAFFASVYDFFVGAWSGSEILLSCLSMDCRFI
jgi:hypothetical protein